MQVFSASYWWATARESWCGMGLDPFSEDWLEQPEVPLDERNCKQPRTSVYLLTLSHREEILKGTKKISSTNRGKASPLSGLEGTEHGDSATALSQHPTSSASSCQACAASRGMVAHVPCVHTVTQPRKLNVCVNRCGFCIYSRTIQFIQWSATCRVLPYHFRCMVTCRAFCLCSLHTGI